MNCYKHTDRQALAVCRECGKATCQECCSDTGHGIACSQTCADQLRDSYRLRTQMQQSVGIGARPPMPASVTTYAFFGLILLITGVYLSLTRPGLDFLTFAMAAAFFVMAGVTYRSHRSACRSC